MAKSKDPSQEEPVSKTWSRLVEVVLGLFLLVGTGVMVHYYASPSPLDLPLPINPAPVDPHKIEREQNELQRNELRQLSRDVDELKQEQAEE